MILFFIFFFITIVTEKVGRDKLAVVVSGIKKSGFSDALLKERLDPPLLAVCMYVWM